MNMSDMSPKRTKAANSFGRLLASETTVVVCRKLARFSPVCLAKSLKAVLVIQLWSAGSLQDSRLVVWRKVLKL